MKLCTGCKYLGANRPICTYEVGNQHHHFYTEEFTARRMVHIAYPDLEHQRSEQGACGPEAKLYIPTVWRVIKCFFKRR